MKQRVDALIQAATGQASIDGLVDSIHSQINSVRANTTLTHDKIKSLINDFTAGIVEGEWGKPAGIIPGSGTGVQKALTGYLMKGAKGIGGIDNFKGEAERDKDNLHDILFKIAATNLAQGNISEQHIECFKNYVSSYPEVAIRNADFISNNHRAVDSALQALGHQASQLQAALDARQHAPGQEEGDLAARLKRQREAYQRGQGM